MGCLFIWMNFSQIYIPKTKKRRLFVLRILLARVVAFLFRRSSFVSFIHIPRQ